MTKILYLHGFASSADSTKANLIDSFIKKNTKKTKILIPDLDNNIENAYHQIEKIILKESPSSFMGSSLGGFYGIYFSEKYNLPCVNINPAIPPLSMSEYLGENKNYSTGDKFIIDQKQLDFLDAMGQKIKKIKKKDRPEKQAIVNAIQAWNKCDDWKKEGGSFVPGLHLWIKNEKWLDLPEQPAKKPIRILTKEML